MSTVELLEKAKAAGLTLRVEKGELCGRGKKPSEALREQIAENRDEIIQYLTGAFRRESEEFLREVRLFWPGAIMVNQTLH
jgi:TubC N-terminal docking domain